MTCKKTCEHCFQFRIKSDNYGVCDSPKNTTKTMSVGIIQKLTGCEAEIAQEINDTLRFHKNFGCIHFEPYPKKD